MDIWEHILNLVEHFHNVAPPECSGVAFHSSQLPPSVFEVHQFLTSLLYPSVESHTLICHIQQFLMSCAVFSHTLFS